jgi:hypothetical protein
MEKPGNAPGFSFTGQLNGSLRYAAGPPKQRDNHADGRSAHPKKEE